MIEVILPGEPHAQGRGRAGAVYRRGPDGRPVPVQVNGRVIVRVHDPSESRNWKAYAATLIRQARGDAATIAGPVRLEVEAVFSCPRSAWKKRVPTPRRWRTGRPDIENVVKAVMDAATAAGLYLDDAQVVELEVRKFTGAQAETPYVRLRVEELPKLVASTEHRPRQIAGASVHTSAPLFGGYQGGQ